MKPVCTQFLAACYPMQIVCFLVNSLTVVSPCVIYMLRDMDIMEDLYDMRKVSEEMTLCISCPRAISSCLHAFVCKGSSNPRRPEKE